MSDTPTPMLKQYLEIKSNYQDCLLFFRLGDFYELFFDDAVTASSILSITLTSRSKSEGNKIPMCGVPFHAAEQYIAKLIKAGHKVAICEQLEDPKPGSIVKRDVIQVVTPGATFSDYILDEASSNYLVAVAPSSSEIGYAYADISTGELVTGICASPSACVDLLAGIAPKECIISSEVPPHDPLVLALRPLSLLFSPIDAHRCSLAMTTQTILQHFDVQSLVGLGIAEHLPISIAVGMLLSYIQDTQKQALGHIQRLQIRTDSDSMHLDKQTIASLELLQSLQTGSRKGSLLETLDTTVTSLGSRLLKSLVIRPLTVKQKIQDRLDAVEMLTHDEELLRTLRKNVLKNIADIERIVARVSTQKATPPDLVALGSSLQQIVTVKTLLASTDAMLLQQIHQSLDALPILCNQIINTLTDEPPLQIGKGNVIRSGVHAELDDVRALQEQGNAWLVSYQQQERERTGIHSLKIGYTKVFGYYLEVTNTHKDKIPENYIRKQTLTAGERYSTEALQAYEEKILHADETMAKLEKEIFAKLMSNIQSYCFILQKNASSIALLDVLCSFAHTAQHYTYCKPILTDDATISIKEGRHPVVERLLPPSSFIPNDTALSNNDQQIVLLTGPNMAGKSTYIRQTALLTLMVHLGSYVPATSCSMGIVDRIFTRVGASDNIAEGQSTFMVEMQETAIILHHCTEKSLIILDEVGRGTATTDGLSIAWAIIEYLHGAKDKGPKTLFATHYHELLQVAEELPRVQSYTVSVEEHEQDVVFLHKIVPGALDKSYGIHVAQLAGLPHQVIQRAQVLLQLLTDQNPSKILPVPSPIDHTKEQMPLFEKQPPHPALKKLATLDINATTPMQALQELYELSKMVTKE